MTFLSSSLPLTSQSHKIRYFCSNTPTNTVASISDNAHKCTNDEDDHAFALTPSPSSFTDEYSLEKARKVKEVKALLNEVAYEEPSEGLEVVDAIYRLGIDHLFRDEIEALLRKQYTNLSILSQDLGSDLHEVAISFRLLRQEGYYVPADIFSKFMDKEGNFNQKLSQDMRGLMELYEASHLSIEGDDDILDQGRDFSSQLLKAHMTQVDHLQAEVIRNTLALPQRLSLPMFSTTSFLTSDFLEKSSTRSRWMNLLSQLAKTDLHLMRPIHHKEIRQVSKWWKDMGLAKELKFARDQPLKWYMWSKVALVDPILSEERVDLTKPTSLIYIIDDIYDVMGTLDELTLFTQAVNSWESSEQLPEYMKKCFDALNQVTNEISHKVTVKHGWNPVDSLRKTWADLCNAFLVEAKWFSSGKLPNSEEYLKNGIVSSGAHVVLVHIFFLLGENITEETADVVDLTPSIISSTATILRLWDDLGSAKDENQDGHDGSFIECYMREKPSVSVQTAREHVTEMISEAWKLLNRECLSPPSPFAASFRRACLNLAKMVPLMYKYDENHCLPLVEEHVKSLLINGDVSP